MPCLFFVLALFVPRLVIVLLWLFSNWFQGVFAGMALPVLGFLFLPTTLLWYSVVMNAWRGAWTFWPLVGLVIAILIDLSQGGAQRLGRRGRTWG